MPWRYHLSPDTICDYTYPLHSIAHAALQSWKGHPSQYTFPLPPNFDQYALALEKALVEPLASHHLVIFHRFVYPLLSLQESIEEDNKWSMFIECWMALYCLEPEGNFCEAVNFTGILAKLEYICRAVTLYESMEKKSVFPDGSLFRQVAHYFIS